MLLQGDTERATSLLSESLRLSTEGSDKSGLPQALHSLGLAALAPGDANTASLRLRERLSLRREMGERLGMVEGIEALARVEVSNEPEAEAARRTLGWLGAADALRDRMGTPRPPVDRPGYEAALAAAAARCPDATLAMQLGSSLTLEQVVAAVLAPIPTTSVAQVGRPVPAAAAAATAVGSPAGLTPREIEVLRLIAAGRTNQEIAATLVVSANTVRHHVTHILDKTGSENRTTAAAFAVRHNLL